MTLFSHTPKRSESALEVDLWISQLGLVALKAQDKESLIDIDRAAAKSLHEYLRRWLHEGPQEAPANADDKLREALAIVRVVGREPGQEEAEAARLLLPLLSRLCSAESLTEHQAEELVSLLDLLEAPQRENHGIPAAIADA